MQRGNGINPVYNLSIVGEVGHNDAHDEFTESRILERQAEGPGICIVKKILGRLDSFYDRGI